MHFQLIIFVSVLLPVAHLEPTRPCCQLEHLEKCTVFQHAGRSICTQTTEDDNNHGGCPRKVRQDPDDVPSHVSLVDYTVGYSPCNPSEDSSAGCSGDGSGSLVVTLNVSFTLDGNNVEELLFQVDGLRDTRTSCHYVRLIETLTHGDVIQNQKKRLLYFDGFDEDFLPGSTHVVYARTLPDHVDSSLHVVSNLSVKIPDCGSIERRDKVYYCTLPSPANWHSEVYAEEVYDGAISSVHVTFTTSDEAPRIGYYKVTLGRSDMKPTKYKIIFNNSTFWHWNGTLGSNVLEHTFVNVTPGTYNVTVHPRFLDKPCTDPLWRMRNDCPEFGRSFQVKGEAVTVPSTTLPLPPPVTAAPLTFLEQHWYWFLGVAVVGLVLLILLAGVCCCVCRRQYKQPIIGPDDITIYKSERRFIHRPLERPYKPVNGVEGSIPDQTLSYQEDGGSQLLDYPDQAGNDWEGVLRQDSGISVSSHNEGDNHVGVSGTTPPIMEEVDIESVL